MTEIFPQHDQELTDRGARGLEVDYELDLELEEFEAFQLPKLSASRYLHDFGKNLTGIVGRIQLISVLLISNTYHLTLIVRISRIT